MAPRAFSSNSSNNSQLRNVPSLGTLHSATYTTRQQPVTHAVPKTPQPGGASANTVTHDPFSMPIARGDHPDRPVEAQHAEDHFRPMMKQQPTGPTATYAGGRSRTSDPEAGRMGTTAPLPPPQAPGRMTRAVNRLKSFKSFRNLAKKVDPREKDAESGR